MRALNRWFIAVNSFFLPLERWSQRRPFEAKLRQAHHIGIFPPYVGEWVVQDSPPSGQQRREHVRADRVITQKAAAILGRKVPWWPSPAPRKSYIKGTML